MKKLLSFLAASTLCLGSTVTVISCKKEKDVDRDKDIKYNPDLIKDLIVEINGMLAGINMGDLVKNSELLDLVVKKIDESIGLQNFFDATNANLRQIKDVYDANNSEKKVELWKDTNQFKSEYNKLSDSATRNRLFTEYTKSISNKSPMDYSQISKGYSLNVQNKAEKVKDIDGKEVNIEPGSYIKFLDGDKQKRWVINGEIIENGEMWKDETSLPSIEILTKEFKEEGKEKDNEKKANFFVYKDDKEVCKITSAVALSLRFQDYFDNRLKADAVVNALTMSHNLSNMYLFSEKTAKINIFNTIAKSTTKWPENSTNLFGTNVKMVWTLQFDKTKLEGKENIEAILDSLKTEKIVDQNFNLSEDKSIKDIFNHLKGKYKEKVVDQKDNQYDSYFGLEGYKGISFIDNGSSFGPDILEGKKYGENIKKYNDRGGVIIKDGTNYGFEDENDPTKINIPIVLPVHLVQLLGGSEDISKNVKIKDSENKTVANINLHKYARFWNSTTNKQLHSKDVQEIANNDTLQNNLLTEIIYMISLNVKNQDEAKYASYPKYLTKWSIYNAELWKRIGKYIGDFKNEDM